jgi:hypothetical protein
MRYFAVLMCVALLTACGGGRESRAVAACEKAIAERITDKPFAVDRSDMAANAVADGDDIVRIRSRIVFDPGLPREETQNFDCRARFTADRRDPDIISLSFIW